MRRKDRETPTEDSGWQPKRVGRYESFCALARGGMATVHLGRWVRNGGLSRLVALKAIHPHLASEEQHRRAFVDEARLSVRIRHPNVITTLDLVDDDGVMVMVMDFVPGLTLSALGKRAAEQDAPVPLPIARRLAVDLLRGLHAAHTTQSADGDPLHIVHRDISPDNLLVGEDGRARVIDFGIAHAEQRSTFTATGIIKGKLRYLAPEQLLEGEVDARTDVYSASVVLWQLLTGQRLFGDKDDGSVIFQVVRGGLRRAQEVRPDLPEALDAVVMRGLATDPDERWPSAEAMADAIESSGSMASYRDVGSWANELGGETIDGLRRLGRAVETAPPISERTAPTEERTLHSAIRYEPEMVQERSRTQLTSQADVAATAPPSSSWSTAGVVALTLAVGVATTVAVLRPAASPPPSAASGLPAVEAMPEAPPPPAPEPSSAPAVTALPGATPREEPSAPKVAPPAPPPERSIQRRRAPPARRRAASPTRRLPSGI